MSTMMNKLQCRVTDIESKKSKVENNLNDIVVALPQEIAELIPQMLDIVDYHRFSAVSKTWRSIAVGAKKNQHFSLQQLPWLLRCSNSSFEDDRHGFFSLVHGRILKLKLPEVCGCSCSGSSCGWLIMSTKNAHPFLFNPFCRLQIQLPSQSTNPGPSYIRKAILTPPSPISIASGKKGCIVVAIYGRERLGYCRPGDEAWTDLTEHLGLIGLNRPCILDIILFNKQLYAVTGEFELVLIEIDPHPKCTKVKVDMPRPVRECIIREFTKSIYLVESCGELLMVVRYRSGSQSIWYQPYPLTMSTFMVFKLDSSGLRWNKVDDLGDRMIFVGTGSGIARSARRFSGFSGNCIYFTEDNYSDPLPTYNGPDFGVFSLDDGSIKSFCPFGTKFSSPSPVWYIPTQF